MADSFSPRTIIIALLGLLLVGGALLLYLNLKGPEPVPSPPSPSSTPMSFRNDGMVRFLDPKGAVISEVTVEIARTPEAREQGLMGRTVMAEDQGMLFLFDRQEPQSFWMANTPLSLDIIFVNAAKHVVKIHENTQPYSERSLPSGAPSQYVVEVNGGYCARKGIKEGFSVDWTEQDQ